MLDVVGANYIKDFQVEVIFENGKKGIVDFSEYPKRGGVFSPMVDMEFFKQLFVNAELGTICWPNGADIAPETLYSKISSI